MDEPAEQKKKLSTGAKVGIGCGSGCLILLILAIIGGFISYRVIMSKVDQAAEELKAKGFENVQKGQMVQLNEPLTEKKLLMGQIVKVMQGSTNDLAIMAQMGEVFGTIEGDLYFRGQILTLQPGSVIRGNLDIQAQALQNHGEIEGEIIGSTTDVP